jgi:hypothetical protein
LSDEWSAREARDARRDKKCTRNYVGLMKYAETWARMFSGMATGKARALPLRRDRQLLLYTSSATIAMGHLLGASQVCERVLESARW